MNKPLEAHPVALLFPELPDDEFAALKEDIRRHGVRVPILVHGGQILDGRHRYRACRELGLPCRMVEWNGHDPWLEAQSRNLMRRHLAKDQIYAIQKLALQKFPELAIPIETIRANALARKAQAKGKPRGQKALSRSHDRYKESADVIGAFVGVSGTTVKRVDRLAREAPELLPKIAAGELSVKHALREVASARESQAAVGDKAGKALPSFSANRAVRQLEQVLRVEWTKWPREHRARFLDALQRQLGELIHEHAGPPPAAKRDAWAADARQG